MIKKPTGYDEAESQLYWGVPAAAERKVCVRDQAGCRHRVKNGNEQFVILYGGPG